MSFGFGLNPVGFNPAVTGAYGFGGAPGVSTDYWGSAQFQGVAAFLDSGASTTQLFGGGGYRAGSALFGGGELGRWAVANDASWAALTNSINRIASMSFFSAAPAFGFPSAPGFPSVPMAFGPGEGAPAQPVRQQAPSFDAKFSADEPAVKVKEEKKPEELAKGEKPMQDAWTTPFKDDVRAKKLAKQYLDQKIASKKDKAIRKDVVSADVDYTAIVNNTTKDKQGNFTPKAIRAAAQNYFNTKVAGDWKKS